MLMFVLVAVSTIWMHVAIRRMERERHPALGEEKYLSDVPHEPHPMPRSAQRKPATAAAQSAG